VSSRQQRLEACPSLLIPDDQKPRTRFVRTSAGYAPTAIYFVYSRFVRTSAGYAPTAIYFVYSRFVRTSAGYAPCHIYCLLELDMLLLPLSRYTLDHELVRVVDYQITNSFCTNLVARHPPAPHSRVYIVYCNTYCLLFIGNRVISSQGKYPTTNSV